MKTITLEEADLFDKYATRLREIEKEINSISNSNRLDKTGQINKLMEEHCEINKWFIRTN